MKHMESQTDLFSHQNFTFHPEGNKMTDTAQMSCQFVKIPMWLPNVNLLNTHKHDHGCKAHICKI